MKRILKAILWSILGLLALIASACAYWNRSQTIDFEKLLPVSITICSNEVGPTSQDYATLRTWLSNNRHGWVNTIASYAPGTRATAQNIDINVWDTCVIINYTADGRKWHQVTKDKRANELRFTCSPANQAL
jgi:hypothetical protein